MEDPAFDSVDQFLASLDAATRADADELLAMMRRVSGLEPTLWNVGTIGFGTYHYKYVTGREGQGHIIGFYPRRGKTTVYLMDGTARYASLLDTLGPHTTTGYCVYLKRVGDVNAEVLERIVRSSFEHISAKAAQGPITQILWKSAN